MLNFITFHRRCVQERWKKKKKLKSIELIFMKCLSIIPRGKNPSKFACSTIKFKACGCPLTQFYSLSMRQARCIKTGRCFWLGQSSPDIFTHPPGSSRRHLGFGIFLKDAMTGRLREPWIERRPSNTCNIWVLIAVQISYESGACGTAVLGCVGWLLGTSRVDRLWLPYKAALPEGCELQINAEPRVNVKRAAV